MKDNLFCILIYLGIAGISYLLAPLLTYLFLIIGVLLAGVGLILDIILSLLLWWAGFEGGIGMAIMDFVNVMSPTTAWLIFMAIMAVIFFICLYDDDFDVEATPKKILIETKCGFIPIRISMPHKLYIQINDITDKYMADEISKKTANKRIKMLFEKWIMEKYGRTKREANIIWENNKSIVGIE